MGTRGKIVVSMHKFMQSLDPHVYAELKHTAMDRGITMQELIRAIVIPE